VPLRSDCPIMRRVEQTEVIPASDLVQVETRCQIHLAFGWHARCTESGITMSEDVRMDHESTRKRRPTGSSAISSRQLAERFVELKQLRQKVRATESERNAGRQGIAKTEPDQDVCN
jgi:hypothetical protein